MAWHQEENALFSVYRSGYEDHQVSITDLTRAQGEWRAHVRFIEERFHGKGAINSISFMPWESSSFVIGGSDHAVILWNMDDQIMWKPIPLNWNIHTSAVMGVAGMHQNQVVLSAKKDRRILGYDAHVGRQRFVHQLDSSCLGALPNPRDVNLYMVQTGTPERQLGLYDIRAKGMALHCFGWKQQSGDIQSALVQQDWSPNGLYVSPNGLYVSSGSADPMIHVFDTRYNGCTPSQSVKAHEKRICKAM